MIVQYVIPLLISFSWLYVVTYLQHHYPHTKVYDDSKWSFFLGALETVDRTYGYGIDALTHHITDGHFVHHLFYTEIPHYELSTATKAIDEATKGVRISIVTPNPLKECINIRSQTPLVKLDTDGIYRLSEPEL